MAESVGQIGLDLVVNQNQFKQQMSGIMGMAKKAGAALAAAFAVKKIVDFGKSCIDLGSDLAEVQNVVDVIFPHMADQVDKFAKSAASSYGLSETMAKKYSGTFGSMAKAFGFTEKQALNMGTSLTALTGDVASFYNLNQDEAYTKLKSVFTGETESLKDLGVVMTQTALDAYAMSNGFGKTTSAMSEAEKVALRYQFVQDQLSAAQGDFARTSGGWANQVRILSLQFDSLKATIGQGLINVLTPVLKVINTLLGKLSVLASAFKSFTELITGQKSTAGSSNGVAAVAGFAADAGDSLESASDSAADLTNNTNKAGNAAKKAAKEMRSLMGFDKINKLDKPTTDTSSGSSKKSTSPGAAVPAVDFGGLAEGDTVIDQVDGKMSGLIKRCRELAGLFKRGFRIGFGDSNKRIQTITNSIRNIGTTLKGIFTDPKVVTAANNCANSIALALGKIVGSAASIGVSCATMLIGGVDRYLTQNQTYIKEKVISIFNVTGDIAGLVGELCTSFAEIFTVFSGPEAQQITADIIGIFSNGFLGVIDVGLKFVEDLLGAVITPITNNVEGIKTVIENTLGPIQTVLDTLCQSVTDTFSKISDTYDLYVKPFIDSIAQGVSDIIGTLTEGYNTYIAPVLDYLAGKFTEVWEESIQPAIDGVIELLGTVFENLQALWETLLVPLIEWVIANIMPIIGPILKDIGDLFLDLLKVAGDVISGVMKVLNGFIKFCTGVFTGDFSKCWKGIEDILEGFKKIAGTVFEFVNKYILQPFIDFIKNIFETDWSDSFGVLGEVMNTFLRSMKKIWEDIKEVFNGVIKFITGIFSGNWKKAWEGIKDIFRGVFEGLADLAETPLNAIITAFNGVIGLVNGMINRINGIKFKITVPDWIPGIGGSWWGFNGFGIPEIPTIPLLAQGGYVKPNTPQLAMIGDNRHQGEVVAPEDKLQAMVDEAVSRSGGGSISRDELEGIINRAVMRIIAALANLGFAIDGETIAKARNLAQVGIDRRFNTVDIA